jgi:hypothetical protein
MDTFFALPERATLDEFKHCLSIINENIIFNRLLLMVGCSPSSTNTARFSPSMTIF